MKRLIPMLLVVLALSACSSPVSKPSIKVGEDANAIASLIRGCHGVKAEDVGAGGPSLVSTASCTLGGHKVYVDSFSSTEEANLDALLKTSGVEAYYATGKAWAVILGDDPTLQEQITNDAAALLQHGFDHPTANLDAEKRVAAAAVASLGGSVRHVK